ncbi:hypothetical protein [Actinomadura sp. WMMB 499]|uniref:hypothetical protein n=1 Tax=Actinomadura sp. WMMB 499 TaxID=1219491 RepID=UPI001248B141|nr:hypothetical protein [Actinomadura sp. WMMB 499]QFG22760.1 hypothetical protein F7P10_18190 [Actinomadura sp. WMMB 499]
MNRETRKSSTSFAAARPGAPVRDPRRVVAFAVRRHAGWLAGRALTAASYGEHDRSADLTARAVRRGPDGVERLVKVWCRTILSDRPPAGPALAGPGHGGRPDIDRLPVPARWAARVVAAAAARDRAMLRALVGAVPEEEVDVHLACLLRLAVAAVVARDDDTCL